MKAETNEKKELTPGTQTMQQAVEVSSPLFESGGEFVLPDYLPKVQKVLRLLYGPAYGLHMESEPGKGTTITLNMPMETEEELC